MKKFLIVLIALMSFNLFAEEAEISYEDEFTWAKYEMICAHYNVEPTWEQYVYLCEHPMCLLTE